MPHEYDFIKREGVSFCFLTQAACESMRENGTVNSLECFAIEGWGPAEVSGRPSPHLSRDRNSFSLQTKW